MASMTIKGMLIGSETQFDVIDPATGDVFAVPNAPPNFWKPPSQRRKARSRFGRRQILKTVGDCWSPVRSGYATMPMSLSRP